MKLTTKNHGTKLLDWLVKNWPTWTICLIIISGSLNLFVKYYFPEVYVQGWLVDYLHPKFYLSDIFIILFMIFTALEICVKREWGEVLGFFRLSFGRVENQQPHSPLNQKQTPTPLIATKPHPKLTATRLLVIIWAILLLTLGLRQIWTLVPLAAAAGYGKMLEIGLWLVALKLSLARPGRRLHPEPLFWTFVGVIFGQSTLGLYQFCTQNLTIMLY